MGDYVARNNTANFKKYMQNKKKLAVYVSLDLDKQFTEKLKEDKLTKQEVLETAVYQYINGELRVNKIK